MEVMDCSLDQFYRQVFQAGEEIPEPCLANISVCVSIYIISSGLLATAVCHMLVSEVATFALFLELPFSLWPSHYFTVFVRETFILF